MVLESLCGITSYLGANIIVWFYSTESWSKKLMCRVTYDMKKPILLLFIPLVSFSQSPIVYYDDEDYSLFDIIILTALAFIFYYYYKKFSKKWKS